MACFRETIEVDVPVERAFPYVADFTTAAEWDPGIVSSRRTAGGGEVGTTYAVEALFRGRSVRFTYRVVEFEHNRTIVLHGVGARAVSDDTIQFEETSTGGTRITYEADIRFTGVLRLVEPLLAGTIRELGEKALAGLQATLAVRA
jgi:carbon monoxide dehydrogenase subunit G